MSISDRQYKYATKIMQRMEKTAFIRFDVAERLERDERFSAVLSAVLSIYLVCTSIIFVLFPEYSTSNSGIAISLIGITCAISLLVLNLFDHAQKRSARATIMLQNAQAVHSMAQEIELKVENGEISSSNLTQLVGRYQESLKHAGINHTQLDHQLHLSAKRSREGVPLLLQHQFRLARYHISSKWLPLAVLAAAGCGFFLMVADASSFIKALFG